MKFSKKHFFTIMFLLILLAGIYIGLKNRIVESSNVNISNEVPMDSSIADLMASMSIHQFTEPVKAPDFELTSLEGERHRLRQYRGKVVFLSFWATW